MDQTTIRRIIRAKWQSFADHLPRDAKAQASLLLVEEFNALLAHTTQHLPDTKAFTPKPIGGQSEFAELGLSSVPAADLRTIAMQVVATIDAAYPG